jgi:protein-disulfide isomerase
MSPSPKCRRKLKAGQTTPEPVAQQVWTIRSIGTLWLGLVMLAIGALCGLVIQPLVAAAPAPAATAEQQASVVEPTRPSPTQDNSPRGAMMRGVVSQTRHFLGDENAPVTIVEFCDFEASDCARFVNDVFSQF